jgi:hypothetical protein
LQRWLVDRPGALAAVARTLPAAGQVSAISGAWSVFWNELLNGAPPGRHRTVAGWVTYLGQMLTARTPTASWFDATFSP